ncbi:MAG: Sensor protein irlS [Rhizobacter sp.]|nr:Sensor protein irlS [Rhizobacter sp.]
MYSMTTRLDPRRWSLQWRLTALFFATTTTILCAVGWAVYDQLTHQLWEKDEATVRATIEVQLSILQAMDSEGGNNQWQREWSEHTLRDKDLAIRLMDPDGRVVASSKGLNVPVDAYPEPKTQRTALKRYVVKDGKKTRRYMLASSDIETRPGRRWKVQAAYNLTETQELIETFTRRLVMVVSGAVLAASLIAFHLVRRGLQPLRVMTSAVGGIDAQRLHRRLSDRAWPSDLRLLANSFDEMLGRLEAAFAQLSRFSSDLAHEFRSPITNLVAAAGVMLSRERTLAEYQDTLAVVVEEGDRLSRMVSSMLFLARAEDATQALNLETIELEAYLDQIREAYELVADEAQVVLSCEAEGSVLADRLLLRNAISNLVSNALRYTPAHGAVTISSRSTPSGTFISVVDTGVGIEAHHLPKVFDRFFRADASRSDGDHTGLGLAVVQSIAELHGGQVSVESTHHQGSRFVIWIPATELALP